MLFTPVMRYVSGFIALFFISSTSYASSVVVSSTPATKNVAVSIQTSKKPSVSPVKPVLVTSKSPAKKPAHKPIVVKPLKPVVIVRKPMHRSYTRINLPKTASFVVIAGISYAVINNAYYKSQDDRYEYVENPTSVVGTEQPVVVEDASQDIVVNSSEQGKLVDTIHANAKKVSIEGAIFYVSGSEWYAPVAGTTKFVVVEPQI